MGKRECSYWIAASTVLAACILAGALHGPAPMPLDAQPGNMTRMAAAMSHPDEFNRHFADIRGTTSGYDPYPHNHGMVEFQRALERRAKLGYSTQLNWVERGPGRLGGRTRAIVVDRTQPLLDEYFVGAVGGGVWHARRYTDEFGTERMDWTPLTDHLPSLAISAMAATEDAATIYAGTGEGFYNSDAASGVGMFKTIDRGQSWTQLLSTATAADEDWRFVNRIALDPDDPNTLVVATNGAIYRSTDGGGSFVKVYASLGRVQDLRARPGGFDTLFATVNDTVILRSTDRGVTWVEQFRGFLAPPGRMELAIASSDPGVVYAATDSRPVPLLYRSNDGGNTWAFLQDRRPADWLGGLGWYSNAIAVHPYSADTVFLGGIFRWKTTVHSHDGGSPLYTVHRFVNSAPFVQFLNAGGGHAGGQVDLGYRSVVGHQVRAITAEETVSIEIRFGPGIRQLAHRFTIPPATDAGALVYYGDYSYEDFVEVPFQVWDVDNGRQLHVSFRDQQRDGGWDLVHAGTGDTGATAGHDYVFVSKYPYDAANPVESTVIADQGLRFGLMYALWPVLAPDAAFDPTDLPQSAVAIDFGRLPTGQSQTQAWENGLVHVDHHNLTVLGVDQSTNRFHILSGNDGGLAYSLDGGQTWLEGDVNAGYNTSQFYDATKRPGYSVYLGGTQDNGAWRSYGNANSTRGWISVLGGDGFDVIWKGQDSLMGSIQFNTIWRSLDGGANWEAAGPNTSQAQFMTSLAWSESVQEHVFTMGGEGVFRSDNFGATWRLIAPESNGAWGYYGSGKVRVSLADPNVVWAGYWLRSPDGLASLHVSENALNPFVGRGGQDPPELRPVASPEFAPASVLSGLATHPLDRATAYVLFSVFGHPKVLRTNDLGQTWEDLSGFANSINGQSSNGFPDASVYDLVVFPDQPDIIWVATDMGIFESVDNGQTWHYADNGLPAVSVWRLRIADGELVAATHGRGVWSLELSEVQTPVTHAAEVPEAFELMPNYPNPFNPSTTIGFTVPVEGHVRIVVFDALGRNVATLVDEQIAPGSHQIDWNASHLASGQYFYRLEVADRLIDTRAMVLVK